MKKDDIKRVDIQLNLLDAIIKHWEIKQKRNESDQEFTDTLAFFRKNLFASKQFYLNEVFGKDPIKAVDLMFEEEA